MAKITPFKGVLYNLERISDLSEVITPPFDVISEEERDAFYDRHPNNMIRLILGKKTDADTPENNPYTRAAAYFESWLSDGILVRDDVPALYITETTFSCDPGGRTPDAADESRLKRYGVIAAVELVTFDQGIVLPHERTFSKVKSERLELMKSCHANFSPIFSLYSDRNGVFAELRERIQNAAPYASLTDDRGLSHRMWRITDEAFHDAIVRALADERIFIADGHHRYETALNYKQHVAENDTEFTSEHPANYVMMYLSSMEEPGMVILPAHRMLKEISDEMVDRLIEALPAYFDIDTVQTVSPDGQIQLTDGFELPGQASGSNSVIGVFLKNRPDLMILTIKTGVMKRMFGHELSESLLDLDVTVLTRLIFMEILGFDQARLDNEKLIGYVTGIQDAVSHVAKGKYDAAFILNSTRIDQVRRIAEEGEIMPRKSTYFYPKVITGQVINLLR